MTENIQGRKVTFAESGGILCYFGDCVLLSGVSFFCWQYSKGKNFKDINTMSFPRSQNSLRWDLPVGFWTVVSIKNVDCFHYNEMFLNIFPNDFLVASRVKSFRENSEHEILIATFWNTILPKLVELHFSVRITSSLFCNVIGVLLMKERKKIINGSIICTEGLNVVVAFH